MTLQTSILRSYSENASRQKLDYQLGTFLLFSIWRRVRQLYQPCDFNALIGVVLLFHPYFHNCLSIARINKDLLNAIPSLTSFKCRPACWQLRCSASEMHVIFPKTNKPSKSLLFIASSYYRNQLEADGRHDNFLLSVAASLLNQNRPSYFHTRLQCFEGQKVVRIPAAYVIAHWTEAVQT